MLSRTESTPPRSLYLERTGADFGRVPSLDGLRAISILLVVFSHYVSPSLFPGGLGVLVFFVVSGFLITRLLYAEAKTTGRVGVRNFYVRRFFRLYPVVTVYTLVVVIFCAVDAKHLNWYEPISALFYFANYVYAWASITGHAAEATMPFAIFWSLSVEEHFYLIFPLLFIFARGKALVMALAVICVFCLVLRILVAHVHPEWLASHMFYFTDMRLDSIAFGVLLAALCETGNAERIVACLSHPWTVVSASVLVLLCLAIRNPWFRETLRYTVLAAGVAVIVGALVFSPRYRVAQVFLNLSFVRWVGVMSYSLYVWHLFLPLLLHAIAPHLSTLVERLAAFGLSLLVASLSYYGLERPMSRLRHRFGSRVADDNGVAARGSNNIAQGRKDTWLAGTSVWAALKEPIL